MRKTKIVCSIGPASESEEVLRGLCLAGMNVARLNFSHGTYEEHQRRIDAIKKVRKELNLPVAIMLDTKGPEFRIKTFSDGKIFLDDGDKFTFTTDEIIGDKNKVSVTYKKLNEELVPGDRILLNNGLLIFSVDSIEGNDINCTVICGGELSDRKSMSFPGKHLKQDYLSEQDKADLLFGVKNEVDYVACSFVSCKQDMIDIRNYLSEIGGEYLDLIAKIENQSGYDNIEEICEHCDGIMVARGAQGNPWIFAEILAAIEGKAYTPPTFEERFEVALEHARGLVQEKGERVGVSESRKHLAWYLHGMRGAAIARNAVMQATTLAEIEQILHSLL